jgi:hypothetical protein
MNSRNLFFNELKYRWQGSLLAAVAVAVAVLSVTAALHLLVDFDRETQKEVRALQHRSQERMDALENETRIFTKSLGFDILVYNEHQRLETFHADDVNTHYLTIAQARALAASNFELLNHHLPFLRQRYRLSEFGGDVIIAGLEGEIYIKRRFQKPLEIRIEPGEVQLGYAVAERLKLKAGNAITIGEKSYSITLCRKQLGTKDDVIIFMNLADAQALLGLADKISGILALSCNCAPGDISPIRTGVRKVIPGAQVAEFTIRARARHSARVATQKAVEAEVADIVKSRMSLRVQLKRFSGIFAGLMVASAAVLLFFLYSHNVKERRHEIAILRTLGVRTSQIYVLFVWKAILLATPGALGGYLGALLLQQSIAADTTFSTLWATSLLLKLLAAANLISISASLIPVMVAARRDPGIVLNEEA